MARARRGAGCQAVNERCLQRSTHSSETLRRNVAWQRFTSNIFTSHLLVVYGPEQRGSQLPQRAAPQAVRPATRDVRRATRCDTRGARGKMSASAVRSEFGLAEGLRQVRLRAWPLACARIRARAHAHKRR